MSLTLHDGPKSTPVQKQYGNPFFGRSSVWDFPSMGGIPKWMVYFMENPIKQWMIRGYHHVRKPTYLYYMNLPRCSMVLDYLPTFTPNMAQLCRYPYTEHLGYRKFQATQWRDFPIFSIINHPFWGSSMTMEIPPYSYQLVAFNTWMCPSKRCPGCPMFHSGGGCQPCASEAGNGEGDGFFRRLG